MLNTNPLTLIINSSIVLGCALPLNMYITIDHWLHKAVYFFSDRAIEDKIKE